MEIRAVEGHAISVPVEESGQVVYMTVQNRHAHRHAVGGLAVFDGLTGLHFGNRREVEGEIWVGKSVRRLVVERRHGN